MRHICGIIVAERKGKQGKEDKVRKTCFLVIFFFCLLSLTKTIFIFKKPKQVL